MVKLSIVKEQNTALSTKLVLRQFTTILFLILSTTLREIAT